MLDQEQKSEAEALFREASECDPSDMVARNGLARLLVHTSREGEAEDLLRWTIKDLPDDLIAPYLMVQYLIAWAARGDRRGARPLRQYLADYDPHPEPEPDMGRPSRRMPRPPSARRHRKGGNAVSRSCTYTCTCTGPTSCFASGDAATAS